MTEQEKKTSAVPEKRPDGSDPTADPTAPLWKRQLKHGLRGRSYDEASKALRPSPAAPPPRKA